MHDVRMPEGEGRQLRVLVADDSIQLQRSLGKLLEWMPDVHVVGYAEDANGTLSMVARLEPDLIVLDVALRGHDRGIDVLREVVRKYPHIKVVMLSNFTWEAMRAGLLEAGAHAYFSKGDEFLRARDWIATLARSHTAGLLPASIHAAAGSRHAVAIESKAV